MRIVKEAEERKNKILDVAERLFCTKGFDHTSTNDILNEIGIARDMLYLVKYQKRELQKVAGGEYDSLSSTQTRI